MIQNLNEELFSFIKKSPTGFHAVHELANYLTEAGFERLAEGNTWNLAEGGKYFVTRNQSAIIAFKVSRKDYSGFHIAASHSDSPTLKIKESSEMNIENQYVKLNVEKYGGMLCAPWFDRPLSVAGRIIVKDGNRLTTKLINVDRDLLTILIVFVTVPYLRSYSCPYFNMKPRIKVPLPDLFRKFQKNVRIITEIIF